MTRAELVEHVTRASDLSKKHAEIVVNTVFDSIIEALSSDEKIELRGFGSFRIRRRQSRVGRNPKTGERVEVPAKRIPYFKPGKELKELINADHTEPAASSASRSHPPAGTQPPSEGDISP
jgi:integration host factor subunit beta